jgi:hypothetical protein
VRLQLDLRLLVGARPLTPADWVERAQAVSDAELAEFRLRICVTGGHIGNANIGTCSRCGGATSSGSMSLCKTCGEELGVCQFDGRLTAWGSQSADDPEGIAARWLALLMRGYSNERDAATRALPGFELPGLAEALAAAADQDPASGSPTTAELIVGFAGEIPEGLPEGSTFLGAPVVSVNPALRSALVRPADAREFEIRAQADPRVGFIELNRQVAQLED